MAANKNKPRNPSTNQAHCKKIHWLELPKELMIESLPRNRQDHSPIHRLVHIASVTKMSIPTSSRRCGRTPPQPRLRRAEEPSCAAGCRFTVPISFQTYLQSSREKFESALVDPVNIRGDPAFQSVERRSYMELDNVVCLDLKRYALSLQGTLVQTDSVRTITGVAANRAIPSLSNWRYFKEHLIVLDGEIILVLLVNRESVGVVDGVEVFRLCLRKLKWSRAGRLGGKVVCLGPRNVWADSAEIGCKGDRVYFTQASFNGWVVYDMETCCISFNN